MSDLEVQYLVVGRVARDWDECQVYLTAASTQVDDLPVPAFTPPVQAAAQRFRMLWAGYVRDLGQQAEVRGDGLRDALRDFVAADQGAHSKAFRLHGLLEEVR